MIHCTLPRPDLLDAPPVGPRLVPVPFGSVVAFGREAAVYLALDVIAVADGFVEESARVAFVEGCHDFLAVCRGWLDDDCVKWGLCWSVTY